MVEAVYEKIGPVGAVIAALSFVSLYLFLASGFYLAWVPHSYRKFLKAFRQPEPAVTEAQSQKNPLSSVLWTTLAHKPLRSEIQGEVQYLFQRSFSSTYISLTILRLISVISPLLGLLGTVLGITRVFHEMSLQSAVDNAMLAGGIWEALITTIMGLTVAIPTLVFYYLLRLRTRALMIRCIEDVRFFLQNRD
ncbi:MAG: biopolymer transport protein ExbB [Verrucomicrobiota bacterium]|jgi:biopolymer transport protein ExbB|nr:biopolymer transport protein ExbB [Verrucomicrobiota bacterium]MDK2962880.1 biopolymer transport protein ExbB [Verrucomicrobiota bacterium]